MLIQIKLRDAILLFIVIALIMVFWLPGKIHELSQALKESTATTAVDPEYEKAELIEVVDGDTLLVSINGEEKYVRLIGIDCPESVNPDESKNTREGEKASLFTKDVLSGVTEVYLEYDVEKTDNYDRLLAYVWFYDRYSEYGMLNCTILMGGYANLMPIEPNTAHKEELEEAYEAKLMSFI